jgi:transposase-like protein
MRSPRSTSVEEFWRAHVTAWARSGLSARAYAAEHNLKAPTLYQWRRRLREPQPPPTPRLVPLAVEAPTLCELVLRDGPCLPG